MFENVTVTWDRTDIGGDGLAGQITFQLSAPLIDQGSGDVAEASPPKTYFFVNSTGTSGPLVANDSSGAVPATTYYTVTVAIDGARAYSFTTLVNFANGSTQALAYLQANAAAPGTQYVQVMPLPQGTPQQGDAPIVQADGSAVTAWGSPGSAAVSSVFGRQGAITARSGDYTASQVTGAAPLASPALTGTPTAPTASPGTNTTQVATTAFVAAAVPSVPVASVFGRTGTVAAATGDYSVGQVTGAAPLASPALTGSPTAPTQTAEDSSAKIATDAFVTTAVAAETTRAETAEALLVPLSQKGAASGVATLDAGTRVPAAQLPAATGSAQGAVELTGDLGGTAPSPQVTGTHLASPLPLAQGGTGQNAASSTALLSGLGAAPLASPALTGTPTAPTATAGTNTTQLATTAYTTAAVAAETARAETAEALLQVAPLPADSGFLGWAYDPVIAANASNQPAAGDLLAVRIKVPACTISYLWLGINQNGSGLTAGQNLAALYSGDGSVLLSATGDQSTAWGNGYTAVKMALTTPQTVAAGWVYGAWFTNGSQLPKFQWAGSANLVNANLSSPVARFAHAGSGRTTLPSSLALSTNGDAYWAAVS